MLTSGEATRQTTHGSLEMTEITDADVKLLKLFVGKQSISNVRAKHGYINFDVCSSDLEGTNTTDCHNIKQSDWNVIKIAFAGGMLRTLPIAMPNSLPNNLKNSEQFSPKVPPLPAT